VEVGGRRGEGEERREVEVEGRRGEGEGEEGRREGERGQSGTETTCKLTFAASTLHLL